MPQTQQQTLSRIASGLHLTQNRSHLPEGALIDAVNVFIDRDGTISKARGVDRYGDALAAAGAFLGEFNDTLLVVDGTTIKYDSDGAGTFTSLASTYTKPTGAVRIRFLEALLALYWTTDVGIKRLANLTATVRDAGLPQGLDIEITESTTGWLASGDSVAYRVSYARIDENDQEIAGADSFRNTHTAAGGANKILTLVTTIPDGIIAGDFLDIWRTLTVTSPTDPGATFFRVARVEVTSADITAGTVTYIDTTDASFLDFAVPLVTNPGQEGPAQEDSLMPLSLDMANYKGHTFLADTAREHAIELRFTDVAGIVDGTDTLTITDGTTPRTYNFEAVESIPAQDFQRFTAGTVGQNVRDTMRSFVRVANRDTGQSYFSAHYSSGPLDAPGKVIIRRRDYADTALSFTATASAGANFEPLLPTSGTSISTTQENVANRLYFSKFEQPDSVPRLNFFDVGTTRNAILRILNLRDSLMILTERKVFRLSGETERDFTIRELDPSTRLRARETAVVLNNAVYAYTSQGVVRIAENGVGIVSRPIEFELNKVLEVANFDTLSFAISYEEERQYWLCVPNATTDTFPTIAWVHNFVTSAWIQRTKAMTSGIVLKEGDNLYLAHAQDTNVLKERKSFSDSQADFADETIAITIDVVTTGPSVDDPDQTVTVLDITNTYTTQAFDVGFLISQGAELARVFAFTELTATTFRCTMDRLATGFTAAAGTMSLGIQSDVAWAPLSLGDVSLTKQYSRVQIYDRQQFSVRNEIGFASDIFSDTVFARAISNPNFGWGLGAWGSSPWGDEGATPATITRAVVPQKFQRARALTVSYRHKLANASFLLTQMAAQVRMVSERSHRPPR